MSQARELRTALRMRTHSKVNLFLRVMGRRSDGYHEVETVLHGVSLGDDIEIEITDSGDVEIEMVGPSGSLSVPARDENLIYRVASSLLERGAQNAGIRVKVLKKIPIGAGLGGGSGNAAGAIVALNELWAMELDNNVVLEVARAIGADVSYCIVGGTALATARGDELTLLTTGLDVSFVLGLSNQSLLTRDVYATFDELEPPAEVGSTSMVFALGAGDLAEVVALLHNDLEPAAFALRPELADKKRALLDAGALGALVSGSGPTLFGLASDEDHAHAVADSVRADFDQVLVVGSQPECIERLD